MRAFASRWEGEGMGSGRVQEGIGWGQGGCNDELPPCKACKQMGRVRVRHDGARRCGPSEAEDINSCITSSDTVTQTLA